MHAHAVAGQFEPGGESAQLSGARPPPLCLGMAGRAGAGRPRADPRHALERRSRMGGRRQDPVREMRLSPVRRQSDGPHPRILRAYHQHRQQARRRNADDDDAQRPHGHLDALDARHRPPPFWRAQLGKPGNVDRWQIIRFEAPCTIVLDVSVAPAGTGAPQVDRSQGVNGRVLNSITPRPTPPACISGR